jgi:hypothetical protein
MSAPHGEGDHLTDRIQTGSVDFIPHPRSDSL